VKIVLAHVFAKSVPIYIMAPIPCCMFRIIQSAPFEINGRNILLMQTFVFLSVCLCSCCAAFIGE